MTETEKQPRKILIVDDHPLLRGGLGQLINAEDDLEVCGDAEDAAEALKRIEELKPDLVTIDLSLPGRSGVTLIKDVQSRYPELPILVVSMHDESLYAERALRAGARGYVNKQEATTQVIEAIRRILDQGEVYVSESFASRIVTRMVDGEERVGSPVEQLSDRELEVFSLIGRGRGTREIAEALHLSVKTIESHRANIKRKLKLKTTNELALHAIRWTQDQQT